MALLRLKYFLLLCIFISLQGCQTTERIAKIKMINKRSLTMSLTISEKTSEQLDVSPTAALRHQSKYSSL